MKGRGSIDMTPKTDNRILFIHPTEEAWFVARDPLHATGTPDKLDPRDNADTGPGLSFAKAILGKGPDAGIGLIPGGTRRSANQSLSGRPEALYSVSRNDSDGNRPVRGHSHNRAILWLQGESDSLRIKSVDAYEQKLLSLVDCYRRDFNNPDLPFIACTVGSFIHDDEVKRERFRFTEEINEILLSLPDKRNGTACVDARSQRPHRRPRSPQQGTCRWQHQNRPQAFSAPADATLSAPPRRTRAANARRSPSPSPAPARTSFPESLSSADHRIRTIPANRLIITVLWRVAIGEKCPFSCT